MILLQNNIFLMVGGFVLLLSTVPIIVIVRTKVYIKSIPEKITTTHFILIMLKNLLLAITVVTIVGFSIFVLLDVL